MEPVAAYLPFPTGDLATHHGTITLPTVHRRSERMLFPLQKLLLAVYTCPSGDNSQGSLAPPMFCDCAARLLRWYTVVLGAIALKLNCRIPFAPHRELLDKLRPIGCSQTSFAYLKVWNLK